MPMRSSTPITRRGTGRLVAATAVAALHGQRDEGAAVALAEHTHQRGVVLRAVELARSRVDRRECHAVDTNAALAGGVGAVEPVHLAYHGVDRARARGEVVAVDVERDLLLGVV